MHDVEQGDHQLQAVCDGCFGEDEADKHFEGVFRPLQFRKAAAGFHHAHHKEQNEQRKPDGLHRTVDADDHIPDRAAFELLRRLRNELPDLRQLFIPSFQRILQILYDPVIRHSAHLPSAQYRRRPRCPKHPSRPFFDGRTAQCGADHPSARQCAALLRPAFCCVPRCGRG